MFTLSPAYETFIHGRRERDVKLLMQTTQDYDGQGTHKKKEQVTVISQIQFYVVNFWGEGGHVVDQEYDTKISVSNLREIFQPAMRTGRN